MVLNTYMYKLSKSSATNGPRNHSWLVTTRGSPPLVSSCILALSFELYLNIFDSEKKVPLFGRRLTDEH